MIPLELLLRTLVVVLSLLVLLLSALNLIQAAKSREEMQRLRLIGLCGTRRSRLGDTAIDARKDYLVKTRLDRKKALCELQAKVRAL